MKLTKILLFVLLIVIVIGKLYLSHAALLQGIQINTSIHVEDPSIDDNNSDDNSEDQDNQDETNNESGYGDIDEDSSDDQYLSEDIEDISELWDLNGSISLTPRTYPIQNSSINAPENIQTNSDLKLFLKYLSQNDSNITSIILTKENVLFEYKTKVKILGIIPKSYNLKINVDLDQLKYEKNRVKISFPWYVNLGKKPNILNISSSISESQDLNSFDTNNAGDIAFLLESIRDSIKDSINQHIEE